MQQSITHRSPSNIALIKYWGKFGRQYPRNASLSFTLSKAFTETSINYSTRNVKADAQGISLDFLFEGQPNELFAGKIRSFLASITDVFPFLNQLHLQIESTNSFPHSSGIASSASSMSALALCLCSIERQLLGTLSDEAEFLQKASYVARLGSGSASRSVYPMAAVWGETKLIPEASNDYAIPFADRLHADFQGFSDAILIVSRAEKAVSSRAGHALMEGNPFANIRYQQAEQNLEKLLHSLKIGDLSAFVKIVEAEALSLHALMMTSTPSFILMQPNTLAIIQRLQQFRADTKLPICFTLDAGPNVHLLYPKMAETATLDFIKSELQPLCEDGYYILDKVE